MSRDAHIRPAIDSQSHSVDALNLSQRVHDRIYGQLFAAAPSPVRLDEPRVEIDRRHSFVNHDPADLGAAGQNRCQDALLSRTVDQLNEDCTGEIDGFEVSAALRDDPLLWNEIVLEIGRSGEVDLANVRRSTCARLTMHLLGQDLLGRRKIRRGQKLIGCSRSRR